MLTTEVWAQLTEESQSFTASCSAPTRECSRASLTHPLKLAMQQVSLGTYSGRSWSPRISEETKERPVLLLPCDPHSCRVRPLVTSAVPPAILTSLLLPKPSKFILSQFLSRRGLCSCCPSYLGHFPCSSWGCSVYHSQLKCSSSEIRSLISPSPVPCHHVPQI